MESDQDHHSDLSYGTAMETLDEHLAYSPTAHQESAPIDGLHNDSLSDPRDVELAILENIYSAQKTAKSLTQRDLAQAIGLSLGMTNVVLKRLAGRGWLVLKRLNTRTIQYALTQEGLGEMARRTYRFFRDTARKASLYRDLIENFVMRIKRSGNKRIVLAGSSDIDFILEYICDRHGLLFVKGCDAPRAARLGRRKGTVVVESEDGAAGIPDAIPLKSVLEMGP
jgi:predicted transcriptional regulator